MQGIKIARIYRWTRQTKQPEKLPIDHGDIFSPLVNTVPLILLAQLSPPALLLPYSLFGKQTYKNDGSVLLPFCITQRHVLKIIFETKRRLDKILHVNGCFITCTLHQILWSTDQRGCD